MQVKELGLYFSNCEATAMELKKVRPPAAGPYVLLSLATSSAHARLCVCVCVCVHAGPRADL